MNNNNALKIMQLTETTSERITQSMSEWTGFLTTVGRLYKYPYYEQLMIYAQRPDATACADFNLWNNKMNRFIKKGAKGIALIDPMSETTKLRYVFDVSDTIEEKFIAPNKSNLPSSRIVWQMQEHHQEPVVKMLKDTYNTDKIEITDVFYSAANTLAKEFFVEHQQDILPLLENSYLSEYSTQDIAKAFENAVSVSVAYTLMKRCDIDTNSCFSHADFQPIFDFNTTNAVSLLGTAVSKHSEQILREIALTITKSEQERGNINERNNVHEERRLSNSEHNDDTRTRTTTAGQIRQDEKTISRRQQNSTIQFPGTNRETNTAPTGNRPNSNTEIRANNVGITASTSATEQTNSPNAMGSTHEQPESSSGGNNLDGAYLQLNLFPTEIEQIQIIAEKERDSKPKKELTITHPKEDVSVVDQLSLEGKQEDKLAEWLVDFFNSLDTKYKDTFFAETPELKVWTHTKSKKKQLSIHISSPVAHYDKNNSFTYFNKEDNTDEIAINEAIYNNKFLSTLTADSDFSITLTPSTIYIFCHDFEDKQIDFSIADKFKTEILQLGTQQMPQTSPLYQEYLDIKNEYSNDIVLFPLGDFFEVFNEDAKFAASTLGLNLTHRKIGLTDEHIPMCGFPSFMLEQNTQKLLNSGRNVVRVTIENGKKQVSFSPTVTGQGQIEEVNVAMVEENEIVSITSEMYNTKESSGLEVKPGSYLVETEINIPKGLWERLANKGLVANENSEKRIMFSTDGNNWNKFYIADKFGNKHNNINASDVLTSDEYTTMLEVVRNVMPTGEKQTVTTTILYNKGDTVSLENGTSFLIEEITDTKVTLRDPTLLYPIFRAESRENFLQLLDRFPQTQTTPKKAENYRITDVNLGEGTKKEKYQRNISAITALQDIEKDNRPATKEEQQTLSQYVGWGGLSEAFDETKDNWHGEYLQLKDLLSESEYEMARASTLGAYYTSPTVIKAIYDTVEQMGFTTGNILEPACGTGNFFGMLPDSMQGSSLFGVELDSITGRIAKQLYPSANISITGFEKTDLPDSFFDLAIGNVPFGNYKLSEKRYDKKGFLIHDHFFAKAMDKVRPGGVIAFITSKGTMDKQTPDIRRYLAQRSELLGAIRLPNNAFSKNAGTEVTSDIIFLQKRENPIDVDRDWIHLNTDINGIALNSYFVEHPEMIIGKMEMKSSQFGIESTCVPFPDEDLAQQLNKAAANIKGTIAEAELPDMEVSTTTTTIPADPTVKNFSYTLVNGEVYYRENSRMIKPSLKEITQERITGLIELRNCANDLINYQLEDFSDEIIINEQQNLNNRYDAFTKKYGLINSRANSLAFKEDNSYYLLCSLENIDDNGNLDSKADMFTKRTIKQKVSVLSVDTASEALALSIAEKAKIDLDYMSELTGFNHEKIVSDLQGVIFKNPNGYDDEKLGWETADEYLSGNVRQKLSSAIAANEATKGLYAANVEALVTAQPKDLDASEVEVRLGATWIDKKYIEQFMYEVFDTPRWLKGRIEIKYAPFTAEWSVTSKNAIGYNNVEATVTFGTERANAYRILEDTLNLRDIRIYDTVTEPNGKEKRVLNKDATTLAQQKQQVIKDEFRDWIFKDAERRQTLLKQYNETFNSIRPREYDGKHINFNGINLEIELRPHQVDAIAHILYGNNTLLAHEVGAGKTYEMVAAAMESKRLGLCQKSLFAVPNHLTEQWASEFLCLYPSANILVATKKDFETKNRKKFCARIATGDYDAVIIGHSQFERIPMSFERQERLLNEQIDEIIEGISEVKHNNGERFTVKQLERTKKGLEERLEKLKAQERKDNVVTFEQLGVDRLYIDEAHNYKNLFLYTKMRNVAGLSTSDAQKSSDMFLKCRYLDELTGGKGIVFATGTPVSNSMTELYTMQRYLQYSALQESGLFHFDCWASMFGETVTAIELAPEGTGYRARTRFSKFFNLPELMTMFKEVADIKTADQLDLPVPEAIYETVAVKPTEIQQEMVKSLSERAAKVHSNSVDPSEDNMLKITSDGRKLGLDQRVINSMLPDEAGSKVNTCVNNLYEIWKDGAADKLTQLVFCDISTPKGKAQAQDTQSIDEQSQGELFETEDISSLSVENNGLTFNVYEDIRTKLVTKGVPVEQVAFIHEANTEIKKKELFAKVRSGDVRVLIGSTAKCGAGTNIQDKLIALHDLDCPWRPGDLTQRAGRIIRQGNSNKTVKIFRYVTEATFDAYLWQTVENKQKFISQIMTSKSPVRSCEDVDSAALSYAEIKALCAGNPKIKEKMDIDIEVSKLKLLKANHQSSQYKLEDKLLRYFPESIKETQNTIKGLEQDIQMLKENALNEDKFSPMVVKGISYTDKEIAGTALINACKELTGKEPVEIGSYRGFTVSAVFDSLFKRFNATLKGSLSHETVLGDDAKGNIIRIENTLNNLPENLDNVNAILESLYKQQQTTKSEIGKPFPQEQELKTKISRLAVLDAELSMDTAQENKAEVEEDNVNPNPKKSLSQLLATAKEQGKSLNEDREPQIQNNHIVETEK